MNKRSSASSNTTFARAIGLSLILFLIAGFQAVGQTPFSQDSAYAYLKTIAGDIGPRPMGSPNERAAMEFALRKFREFGLQEAFIVPMKETASTGQGSLVNTNSGTAVGILRGKSKRTIVIGGHIDSASPDIPGANDDGSGSAAVIELARVLAQRENESTIVFALFGGEEQGLRGSRHFVKNFDRIDDVVLMFQIDMTNGSEWLIPLVRSGNVQSPEWLVRAAYEELEALGHTGLSYPTHFNSFLTAMPGGGIGSDHEPFLSLGIPAIDFTSDVTDAIHTPQDNLENFVPSGLQRSGDLVFRLVERFDKEMPEETTGSYYLFQLGSLLLFFPPLVLHLFILIAIVLAMIALVRLRAERIADIPRQKIPGLKLFLLMLLIQTCVWLSENVVGIVKETRVPWLSQPNGYFLLGFLAALIGIWISLQLVPRMGFSRQTYRYAFRSVVILFIFLVPMWFVSPELALAPAFGLFFLALSLLVRQRYLKILFWLISPHFMFRLIFSEGLNLISRSMTLLPLEGFLVSFLIHLFYILFFSIWSFPFLLGFAALQFQQEGNFRLLSIFRKPVAGLAILVAFILCVVYLSSQPTYTKEWKQLITVEQQLDLNSGTGTVDLVSYDYLAGTTARMDGKDTLLTGTDQRVRLKEFIPADDPWITTERTVETTNGTNTSFTLLLTLHMKKRPYTLTVSYDGGTATPEEVGAPYVWSSTDNGISLSWYSFPDTLLVIPLTFTPVGADTIRESIEATFAEPLVPVQAENERSSVIHRTTIRTATTIRSD